MGHVLLVTSEMAGRINIMGELARRLEAAGHTAAVASPVDIRERVEALGARYVDIAPPLPPGGPPPSQGTRDLVGRFMAFVRRLGQIRTVTARRNQKIAAANPDLLSTAIETEAPDLVLIDVELPMHIITAAPGTVPVALWTSMLSLWKRPGLPPLGSAIVPGRGVRGSRLGIEGAWVRYRSWKWLRRQRHRVTRLGEDQVSVLRTLAAHTGFPFRREADLHQWLIPCTYRTLPIVSFNAAEFDLPHPVTPTCTYAGPVLPPDGARTHPGIDTREATERLAALYERRASGASRALVYCSFGAWHKGDDRAFLLRILDAVRANPDWDVVVGLGARLDPVSLGEVPSNVHLFDWAPQLEILMNADCAIHHGGISTVNECITTGVPMVVYPFDFMDQPGNGARIEFHGIGEVGDRIHDDAVAIARRIERMLTSREVNEAMTAMQSAFLRYRDEDRAVGFVEQMLAGRPGLAEPPHESPASA